MATLKCFFIILNLFNMLPGINSFVNAKYKETEFWFCSDDEAEIEFEESKAKTPIFIEWEFTSAETNETKVIAELFKKLNYKSGYGSRATIDKKDINKLTLKNITESDSGLYKKTVHNDGIEPNKYTNEVMVTVISPPSSLPSLKLKLTERNLVNVSCEPPQYKGHPEVQLELKDSKDTLLDGLTVLGSDNQYYCCVKGEATKCMNTDESRCVTEKIDNFQQCYVTGISWICLTAFIILFRFVKCNLNLCKEMKRKRFFLEAVSGLVLSFSLMLLISIFLCKDSKSFRLPTAVFIFFGVVLSLTLFIPSMILRFWCKKDTEARDNIQPEGDLNVESQENQAKDNIQPEGDSNVESQETQARHNIQPEGDSNVESKETQVTSPEEANLPLLGNNGNNADMEMDIIRTNR